MIHLYGGLLSLIKYTIICLCEDGTVLRIPQNYIEIENNFNK